MNSIIDRDVVIDRGCSFDPEPDGASMLNPMEKYRRSAV
jgi:hypothetical protein